MDYDATWYGGRPRPRRLCAPLEPSSRPQKKRAQHLTQFLVHICFGQMVGWIEMPPRTEVNLGPGDVVLDGVAAPPPKRGTAPQFSAHVYCGKWLDV